MVALARPASRVSALERRSVEIRHGDILDRRSVRRALRGVERVFHLAGTTDLLLPRSRMFALAVDGTRIVLEEALRAGVQRAVYTSSVAAVGPAAPNSSANEANVWDAGRYGIPYVDAKHEAEVAALRMVARGLPLVIVNPAHVLGRGDPGRSSTTVVRRFMRRQIPAYVDGTINVVGVEDVARGHLLADEHGQIGERYILGNRNYSLTRLFADLGRLSGVEPPVVKLRVEVALALAGVGGRVPLIGMPAPVEIRAASLNWSFISTKAKRQLAWETAPAEDCLEATVAWYRERDRGRLAPPGSRQPLILRTAGALLRRVPLA